MSPSNKKLLMVVGTLLLLLGLINIVIAAEYRTWLAWLQILAGAISLLAASWGKIEKKF